MKNIETERKFLVYSKGWKSVKKPKGQDYLQGYLCTDIKKTVRVRVIETNGFITIKGKFSGFSRYEFEYPIPVEDAMEILRLYTKNLIEKTRYKIEYKSSLWEVDEFNGENTGLVLAEIELRDENESFETPTWITKEVTNDPRYYNAYLSKHPYIMWTKKKPKSQ